VTYVTLETERLTLRPLGFGDFDELAVLHAEESFWRYPFGRGWTNDETRAFLERTISHYEKERFAVCAVVLRDGGQLAGWAGLSVPLFLPEMLPAVEVGWRLGESFRGNGYATEAGTAWVDYGFQQGDLAEIFSIYEAQNAASGGVMKRLGFRLAYETVHPSLGVKLDVMKLTREDWLR
jgi:RimJ/RimL family protein N-acetyltransferase